MDALQLNFSAPDHKACEYLVPNQKVELNTYNRILELRSEIAVSSMRILEEILFQRQWMRDGY